MSTVETNNMARARAEAIMAEVPAIKIGAEVQPPTTGQLGHFTSAFHREMQARLLRISHKAARLEDLLQSEEFLLDLAGDVQASRVRATHSYLQDLGLMPDSNGNGNGGAK